MRERVLLFNACSDNRYYTFLQPPLGILYIASFLRKNGIDVFVSDLNTEKCRKRKRDLIKEYSPTIVGISSNFSNRDQTIKLATLIKMINKDIIVAIGGPHPTIAPLEYRNPNIDYILPYEGEETMLNFVCAKNRDGVERVISQNNSNPDIPGNGSRKRYIDNLDDLPFPAYDMIDVSRYYSNSYKYSPIVSMVTSRGCPSNCIFCSQGVFGKRWRARSAENVVEEMKWLKEKIGVKEISIEDDNFTYDLERVYKICDLLQRESIRIVWQLGNGIRADRVTKDLLKTMKNAGCWKIAIAPEVGDEKSMHKIKKGIKLDQFRHVAQWCKQLGIVHYDYFLMGFPFQNEDNMRKIINFAIELDPLLIDLSKIIPFPGTELFDQFPDRDRYKDNISYHYHSKDSLLEKMYKRAYFKFYIRPKKIIEIVKVLGLKQFFALLIHAVRTIFLKRPLKQGNKLI